MAIVGHLDESTTRINTAIARTSREVELLGEYRTRLIADVVTGKLDVREAAAALLEVNLLAAQDDTFDTDAKSAHDELAAALEGTEA